MNRQNFLDELAGLLIIDMILGHVVDFAGMTDCNWLRPFSFFMFWFYFKSGMFYRPKERMQIIMGGAKKLLTIFVVYSLIGHVVECVVMFVNGDMEWRHYILTPFKDFLLTGSISGNLPLWFLISLYFVQVIYNEFYVRHIKPIFLFLGGLLLASLAFYFGLIYPYYISTITLGLAAYSFGYMFREKQYKNTCLCISLVLYLGILIFCPSFIGFRANSLNDGGSYLLAVIFSLSGCIVFDNVFKKMPNCSVLQFIGKNSMEYYVTHWVILNICSVIYSRLFQRSGVECFCLMAVLSLLIPTMIIKIKTIK